MADEQADDPARNIFRFFDLSGELRNGVYDECITSVDLRLKKRILLVKAEHITPTNLLLVCRQFKNELKDRVRDRAELTVTDIWSPHSHLLEYMLPSAARNITSLQINLLDSIGHGNWVKALVSQLPKLTTLRVAMTVYGEESHPREEYLEDILSDLHVEGCVGWQALRSFNIYYAKKNGDSARHFDLDGMMRILEFCPERRCFERVDPADPPEGQDEARTAG